jgi:hypothetical protein
MRAFRLTLGAECAVDLLDLFLGIRQLNYIRDHVRFSCIVPRAVPYRFQFIIRVSTLIVNPLLPEVP